MGVSSYRFLNDTATPEKIDTLTYIVSTKKSDLSRKKAYLFNCVQPKAKNSILFVWSKEICAIIRMRKYAAYNRCQRKCKQEAVSMEVMDAMSRRRSCRAYLPQQILNEKRDEILKAANAAPVGMGEYQNVRLSVIQSAALLEKLDRCGAAFLGDPSLRPTYGAPTVILVSVSRDSKQDAAYCNAACIVENMHLAATDLGLGSVYLLGCIRALQQDAALQRELKIPEAFFPASALAVGYCAETGHMRALTTDKIKTDYLR